MKKLAIVLLIIITGFIFCGVNEPEGGYFIKSTFEPNTNECIVCLRMLVTTRTIIHVYKLPFLWRVYHYWGRMDKAQVSVS